MIRKSIISLIFLFCILGASAQRIHVSDSIHVNQVAPGVFVHTSVIEYPGFGMVPANGIAVLSEGQLFLGDTCWNDEQTRALVEWFEQEHGAEFVKVFVTHHHPDNLGGLNYGYL